MSRRLLAASAALALAVGPAAIAASPAHAKEYGGFSTSAIAIPLRLEMFEPAIPVPAKPEVELDFSYTRVLADSGPASRARASAMWPGSAVGEGLPLLGETIGLPPELTKDGYPVQVNSSFPSDRTQQSSEPFPGMVQRVSAGERRTVAKAGYTPSGDLNEDVESEDKNPLDSIFEGDLTAIGDILTGTDGGDAENPVQTNPLGALSLLVDVDGMTGIASSENDDETATATATSRLGEIRLLGGLITLGGVDIVNRVSSSLDGGPKLHRTVDVGNLTIAGQKFGFGPDGFTAGGTTTPIPGLPSDPVKLLKSLGIELELPKPTVTKDGTAATVEAEALRITIDLKPLRSQLPLLPLDDLVSQLPDLQEGNVLKGLILSLNTIAPKLVLRLGYSVASANTVAPVDFGTGTLPPPTTGGPITGAGPITGGLPLPEALPPAALPPAVAPPVLTPTVPAAAAPGLPELGSIPLLLILAGLSIAGTIGWYLQRAGVLLLGSAASCSHGLKPGLPDLRKA